MFYYDDKTKKVEKSWPLHVMTLATTSKPLGDTQKYPEQWDALIALIKQRQPKKIGINISKDFGHADGPIRLTTTNCKSVCQMNCATVSSLPSRWQFVG